MYFKILGPLEIAIGPSRDVVPGLRERRILAALLLRPNATVSIDHLINVLWGEAPPRTAREQVQNCTRNLARHLAAQAGEPLIHRAGTSYRLSLAPDQLDATVFDEAVRHARALADAGDDGQADGVLRDALRLWRGEVLNDVATDGLRAGIIHLEELRLGAVEQAVAISVRRGEFAAAVGTLTVEVGRFPFNERLYEQLMTALVGMGRPADALRAYQEVERCLDRELSLRPSLALRQLRREIVAGLDHPVTGPLGAGRLAGPLGREVLGRSARPVSRVGAA